MVPESILAIMELGTTILMSQSAVILRKVVPRSSHSQGIKREFGMSLLLSMGVTTTFNSVKCECIVKRLILPDAGGDYTQSWRVKAGLQLRVAPVAGVLVLELSTVMQTPIGVEALSPTLATTPMRGGVWISDLLTCLTM